MTHFEGAHGGRAPAATDPTGTRWARSEESSWGENKDGDGLASPRASRIAKVRLATPKRRLAMDLGGASPRTHPCWT
eukprot:1371932-Pleurochrysis_carterae.AAC.1